ncbi:MAG TPA: hypothetical protein DCM67_02950 [Propionibacteriaceae bacterium]|nr:hypothetical protein [Propionibacteriaceae bacterium]
MSRVAGLVTCQVHHYVVLTCPRGRRPSAIQSIDQQRPFTTARTQEAPPHPAFSELTRLLQVEVEPAMTASEVTG